MHTVPLMGQREGGKKERRDEYMNDYWTRATLFTAVIRCSD